MDIFLLVFGYLIIWLACIFFSTMIFIALKENPTKEQVAWFICSVAFGWFLPIAYNILFV